MNNDGFIHDYPLLKRLHDFISTDADKPLYKTNEFGLPFSIETFRYLNYS